MTEKLQEIKCYYKSEMADLYDVKLRTFMKWIELIEHKLFEIGYYRSQKMFTLKQVELIFNHVGHPPARNEKEVFSDIKVSIIPYSLKALTNLYDLSKNTFFKQLKRMNKADIKIIMDRNKSKSWKLLRQKSFFNKTEVELIFKNLGHPYKS